MCVLVYVNTRRISYIYIYMCVGAGCAARVENHLKKYASLRAITRADKTY